jgi:hypothetical protein
MAIIRTRDPQDSLETLQQFVQQAEDSGLALVSLAEGLVQGQLRNIATFNFEPDVLPPAQLKKLSSDLSDQQQQLAVAALVADEFSIISFSNVFDGGQLALVVACRKRLGSGPLSPVEVPSDVPPTRVFRDPELRKFFGDLKEKPDPSVAGGVIVDPGWERDNLGKFFIPQLNGLKFDGPGRFDGMVRFHRKVAPNLEAAFVEIGQAGLSNRLLFWSGSFNPRHIGHNPAKPLSAHSWGVAFDLNDAQNEAGKPPAPAGTAGSLVDLVPILAKHGFYWGGRFSSPDGMHFEYARPT